MADWKPPQRMAPDVTDYAKEGPPEDPRLAKLKQASANIAKANEAARRDQTKKRAAGAVLALAGAVTVVGVLVVLVVVKTVMPMFAPPAALEGSRWVGGVEVAEKYGNYSDFATVTFQKADEKTFTARFSVGRDPRDNIAELTGTRNGNRLLVREAKIISGSPFSSAPEVEVRSMVLVVSGKRLKASTEHVTLDVKRQK